MKGLRSEEKYVVYLKTKIVLFCCMTGVHNVKAIDKFD